MKHEDISEMIDDCIKRESKLTEWEQNFISDISWHYEDKGSLTDKQYEKLEAIWERIT